MTTITTTQLYEYLSHELGKETAEKLTAYVEQKAEEEVLNKINHLATKTDLSETKYDLLKWIIVLFFPLYLTILFFLIKH